MAEGEFALTVDTLQKALRTPTEWIGDHDLYAALADVATLQRDVTAIQQYALQAEALATRIDHTLYLAMAHRAWGVAHRLAGDFVAAETRLHQALGLVRGLDTRWQIGRTLFELGETAAARHDRTLARDHYGQALALFEALGAAPDAKRVCEALAALS